MDNIEFIRLEASEAELGWRFDDSLDKDIINQLKAFYGDEFKNMFSPKRKVSLKAFSIAKTTVCWEDLFDWEDEVYDELETIEEFCLKINEGLKLFNWRLPTEDEFEYACGGLLFSWGNQIPDGIPYHQNTEFTKHLEPNNNGLILNSDTYKSELVDGLLKLGDGGEAVCGAYEWPIPWMSLSPSYRYRVNDCFFDCIEEAQIRPVLL